MSSFNVDEQMHICWLMCLLPELRTREDDEELYLEKVLNAMSLVEQATDVRRQQYEGSRIHSTLKEE